MRRAAARVVATALLTIVACGASSAGAQTPGSAPRVAANALVRPAQLGTPPAGHARSGRQVIAVADGVPKVRRELARHPGATREAYLKGASRWQVSYYARAGPGGARGKEIAQVLIDDASGAVLEAWTGYQVAWTMARGYRGAFGRKAVALFVWLPLCLLFFAPFFDRRRPWRLLHLDLLVLLGFSVSLAFFSHGRIGASVPLAYLPLAYLLVRMLLAARRRANPVESLRLAVPASWLAIGLVFLIAFRVGLNVVESNVIDVGYSGVIGANRIAHGMPLYGGWPLDNQHGDTYGPVSYYAYVPFERALGWSGHWDDLPAAHGAALAFDLLTIAGLWMLGRRIRGPTVGVALAYAWAAFPFTLFVSNSNTNDTLVALLIVVALLVAASPAARGAAAALAGLTKFAPLALAPLLATHDAQPGRRRGLALFGSAFVVVMLVALLPALHGSGLRAFYDRTLGYQASRGSPFSIWGYYGGLEWLQTAVKVAAAAFALAAAFLPRRRDVVGLAALGAAVLIAAQLGVTHWFYLYIVWFLPLVLVALLARYAEPERGQAQVTPGAA